MTQTPLPILTRDLIASLATRPNATEADTNARAAALTQQIQAFAPTDPIELMFASHAVAMGTLAARVIEELAKATTPEQERRLRREITSLYRSQQGFVKEIRLHRQAQTRKAKAEAKPAPKPPARPMQPPRGPVQPPPAPPFVMKPPSEVSLAGSPASRAMFAALGAT